MSDLTERKFSLGGRLVFSWKKGQYPVVLTSYDLLKTIAILLMVIDHIGVYIYPDETWFRILGRLCVPIWFFLIGYARTRDISLKVLLGAAIIALGNMAAGENLFPLSILLTLMVGRYYIDAWMGAGRRGGEPFLGLFFLLMMLYFPAAIAFEYGTIGFLFTVFGALCRYRQDAEGYLSKEYKRQITYFAIASFASFIILQSMQLEYLSGQQLSVLCLGMAVVYFILNRFSGAELPNITNALPAFIVWTFKFTGRRTLEIYVAHLLLLKAYGLYSDPERFHLFQWNWVSEGTAGFLASIFK